MIEKVLLHEMMVVLLYHLLLVMMSQHIPMILYIIIIIRLEIKYTSCLGDDVCCRTIRGLGGVLCVSLGN